MNRRKLLSMGAQAIIGILAARLTRGAARKTPHLLFTVDGTEMANRVRTIQRMIAESGEMWRRVRNRENGSNPPLIYFGDGPGFQLRWQSDRWNLTQRNLTHSERAEFDSYIASCRNHISIRIGDPISEQRQDLRVRAWIKNGRDADWNISVDGVARARK